jgi:arylsulfatase A-like enzyme
MLGDDAAQFIAKQHTRPWLLYLAFNAPHTPLQVTEDCIARVKQIADERRRAYAGLIVSLDDAVGKTLQALRDSGQESRTLVFFLSDNGGPTTVTHASNLPLAGEKGQLNEGGVRVPFVVSWPGVLPPGATYDQPVSSLDIFATSAALAGATVPAAHRLDGVNLVPYLKGEKTGSPHDTLYWRTGGGKSFAARQGNYKYLRVGSQEKLFDLADDLGETTDLSARHSDVVQRLQASCEQWNKLNIAPLFDSPNEGRTPKAKTPPVTIQ